MSRRPARFTQADIARAIKALDRLGSNRQVLIDQEGNIRIIPASDVYKSEPPVEPERDIIL